MPSESPAVIERQQSRPAVTRRRVRPTGNDAEQGSGESRGGERRTGERRAKVERRRQIDPTTCERDYDSAEIEFMRAMDEYKRKSGRQFPTWSEVLEVLFAMGYRKVAEPFDIFAAKD